MKLLIYIALSCSLLSAGDLILPNNALAVGTSWICKTGYEKQGNMCVKVDVVIPNNALAVGTSWICKTGYEKQGNKCVTIKSFH